MLALILKLTLAPGLVAGATFVARRIGHRAGGLVSGLPVVAAPIVLIYAVERGDGFARPAAAAAILGLISLVGFCVAYVAVARAGGSAWAAIAAGSAAFGAGTAALTAVHPPLAVSTAATLVAIAAGVIVIDRLAPEVPLSERRSDLILWRLVITAALVLALTGVAHGLSAHLAGLLVPFPIITAVLAGFTQARTGPPAAIQLLGGLTLALVSFLAFFVVLAAVLGHTGDAGAFGLATAASLATWGVLIATVS